MPVRTPRRAFVTVTAVTALLGLTLTGATLAAPAPEAAHAARTAPAVTWSDDFDGAAGSGVDPAKWGHDVGGSGWGNNELEYYTDGAANTALDGQGHLVITARKENPNNYQCWNGTCQYTSGKITTAGKFTQAYGHIEARIKIPRGQGMWPAFWMLGDDIGSNPWPNCGELDIMENVGFEPGTVHGSAHGPGYSGGNPLTGTYTLPNGQAFADDFHTFAIDWAPDSVKWSVDGQVYETRTPADTNGNKWVFDHPFFVILNLAVGGNWPGSPNDGTQFPQTMTVDYVHVSAS
ncbi:MAG TPA: glycoside hydrolase family 16 protein [Streptosporangiaceae bacterium]|jgi:beta-glucanase (GH16 family)